MYACITGYFISPCMPLASISGAGIASHIHMDLPDMEPFPEENPSHPGWAGRGRTISSTPRRMYEPISYDLLFFTLLTYYNITFESYESTLS